MIAPENKERLIIAHALVLEKKEDVAGLVGAAIFESIIEDFESKAGDQYRYKKYHERILTLVEKEVIDNRVEIALNKAHELRNHIIHPSSVPIPYGYKDYKACCTGLIDTLGEAFNINLTVNYEQQASTEYARFPESWKKIGGTLAPELTPLHFANLMHAAEEFVAPLGMYLEVNCLKDMNPRPRFQPLSRLDYTSGYVWLSAVLNIDEPDEYRPRVALPGLTVVFKPAFVSVYVELPGMSQKYKRTYYEQILEPATLVDILGKSPILAKGPYEFFHTWWFADIEKAGTEKYPASVSSFLHRANNEKQFARLQKEWGWTQLRKERLAELDGGLVPITRNSFLIGRCYSREDVLSKYSRELHKEIAKDFRALFPILREIHARTQ